MVIVYTYKISRKISFMKEVRCGRGELEGLPREEINRGSLDVEDPHNTMWLHPRSGCSIELSQTSPYFASLSFHHNQEWQRDALRR
jgi:hypothetical protein